MSLFTDNMERYYKNKKAQDRIQELEKEVEHLKKTLEMERELYVNIRELSKDFHRKLTRLKEAYDMQIDLREALEKKIDKLMINGNDR